MSATPTVAELLALPVTTDVPTAGRCFGMSGKTAYRAVHDGTFPVPVLRLGRRMVVTRAALLRALGVPDVAEVA